MDSYLIAMFIVQICVWNTDGWEKQKTRFLQFPPGRTPPAQADTRVQFHQDQFRFLVVHETQLAIYEATKLECLKQVGSLSSVFMLPANNFIYIFSDVRSLGCSGSHEIPLHQYHMQLSHVIASWYLPAF